MMLTQLEDVALLFVLQIGINKYSQQLCDDLIGNAKIKQKTHK